LGRPLRITARPHPTIDEAWETVRETMIATLHDEVTRARATEHAELDEGWVLLREAVERCRLLDERTAEHREAARKEAELMRIQSWIMLILSV
jgi:hypothetical protein